MRRLLLLLGLSLCHSVAGAFDYLIADRICIPDAVRIPPLKRAPIPVGCELPDCCPGCPPPPVLDWKIKLDARLVTQAELRFEGLAAEELKQLKLSGAARREGDRILLRAGDARISGIPNRPGVKMVTGLLQPTMSQKTAHSLSRQLAPTGSFTDRILIQQFAGPYLVNSFTWDIAIRPCKKPSKPPTLPKDKLKIEGIAPGDDVIVMLDAPTNHGCRDGSGGIEWVFPSTGLTIFDVNLLSPTMTCRSEVTVFSRKHAMKWQALTWTDLPGDTRTVTLDPLIEEDVYVWIKDETDRARAEQQAAEAQRLFLENRVGVRLNWQVKKLCDVVPAAACADPSAPSHPFNIVKGGVSENFLLCPLNPFPPPEPQVQLAPIRAQPFYVANALNVYYVDYGQTGRNCAIADVPSSCITNAWPPYFVKADANITFIGTLESLTTLAHEIGHAYGLRPAACRGHTEGVPGFGQDNIMWTGGTLPRLTFKLGQVFRMNTHADDWGGTMLIPNNSTEPGLSGRVAQPCFPNVSSPACPLLDMD